MKKIAPCIPSGEVRRHLRAWFSSEPGQLLHAGEQALLDAELPRLFGYHLVQVGALGNDKALTFVSRIGHHVLIDPEADCLEAGLLAEPSALPLASDSVDVVVLPHTLEFEQDPHQVLREVERVLVPEGTVIISGFNPWSWFGLWRFLARVWQRGRGTVPWCGRFFGRHRIHDWLSLLGFDVLSTHMIFFRPPFRHASTLRKLAWMERLGGRGWPFFGGAFILVARKRVSTLTPIRPRWRPKRSLVASGVAEPSTRLQSRRPHKQSPINK